MFDSRSWTVFGRSVVRVRSVSGQHRVPHCCDVLPLSSSHLSSPVSSPLHVVLRRDIATRVLLRDVALTCIDIRFRFPGGVRAHLERTFKLCEQISGTRA